MTQITTTLSAVTVYPDRARLVRQGRLSLEPGLHSLEISDLPLQLNPESARAAARGTARARLLGVQLNRVYYTDAPAERVRELEGQLDALQDSLKGLESQTDLLQKQRANLEQLAGRAKIYAAALAKGEMSVEEHLSLLDSLRARAEKLDAELRALAADRRELERLMQKLQNELNQQRSARPRQRYSALVEVEVLQAGNLTLELSYVVANAGWKPLYDLRLIEAEGQPEIEVGYLAQVTQGTGEAWQETSLTLSTARPALAGRLPELDPWFIQPLPPPKPLPPQRLVESAPQPAMAFAKRSTADAELRAAPEAEEVEAEVVAARVDSGGAAVTYHVPGTVTIPADGAPHKVTLARFSLPPQLDYVAAPKLAQAVYRRAKFVNDSPYILLPGQANLFAGDEFLGSTRLDLTAPQAEVELYLGVDDRIKVERELKRREVDKRLIGGKRRIVYGYEITLENHLPSQARLTLHEQFPVSRHEEIKVRLESADPRPAQQTELNGLDWEFTLAPEEKRVARFDFSVEHPQGMEVMGIP